MNREDEHDVRACVFIQSSMRLLRFHSELESEEGGITFNTPLNTPFYIPFKTF